MKQLTDQEAQVTIFLLLSVPYDRLGTNALKNSAAIITRLEQAEEVTEKTDLKSVKKKPEISSKSKS